MSGEKFAKLLTEAVYRIRSLEDKTVRIVQDELGYSIGKKGGASIEHWRKGFIPSKYTDTEQLAREIIRRSDLDANWLHEFLTNAGYPGSSRLVGEIFSPASANSILEGVAPSLNVSKVNGTEITLSSFVTYYNNLPPQLTLFIGREKELAEISAYLVDPACRLLTLTGPGGIGKTRLAIQAALEAIGDARGVNSQTELFPHGACFIPLAALNSVDFLVSTIADSLNFSFFSGEDVEEQLLSYLKEKKLLLVVDNLEHLIQEADLLAQILMRAPGIKIIATSRERLNLRGEWVIEVQGMSYPKLERIAEVSLETAVFSGSAEIESLGQDVNDTQLENYSAVQLFIQSARRVFSDFDPSEKEILYVVQICQLVEGIPLAIELAASWVHILSCEEIIKEIEQTYEFLATSWRDMPERHQSLQAVFDYSWNLLSSQERDIICRLSVFRGGFHREAASQVADASLIILSALVDKSFLIRKAIKQDRTSVRYEMHDLLRQYAAEKLNDDPQEKAKTLMRHGHYYANFLSQREAGLRGDEQIQILGEIGAEIDNIRASIRWAITESNEEILSRCLESLFHFYDIRSWNQEAVDSCNAILVSIQYQGQQTLSVKTEALLCKIKARQAKFYLRLGFSEKARDLLQASLTFFKQQNTHKEIAFCLNQLGYVAYRLGKHDLMRELCEESLALCRQMDYQWGIAEVLESLGELAEVQGDYQKSKRLHQEGLQISQAIGDRRGIASSLNKLGTLDWRLGALEEAQARCQEGLAIYKEIGDRRGIALSFKNVGNVYCELGNYDEARKHYLKGLKISQEVGYRWGVAAFFNNLGAVAWELGEYKKGKELCLKSLHFWRQLGYQVGMAGTLDTLGGVCEALDEDEEAKGYFLEAFNISLQMWAIPTVLTVLIGLATMLAKEGDILRAIEVLTFVLHHQVVDQETTAKAQRRLSMLIPHLSEEALAKATERGKLLTIEGVVEQIGVLQVGA